MSEELVAAAAAHVPTLVVCVCLHDTVQLYARNGSGVLRPLGWLAVHEDIEPIELAESAAELLSRLGWLGGTPPPPPPSARADPHEMSLRLMAIVTCLQSGGPKLARDIVDECGFGHLLTRRSDIYRYLSKLMAQGNIERSGAGTYQDPYRYLVPCVPETPG